MSRAAPAMPLDFASGKKDSQMFESRNPEREHQITQRRKLSPLARRLREGSRRLRRWDERLEDSQSPDRKTRVVRVVVDIEGGELDGCPCLSRAGGQDTPNGLSPRTEQGRR